MYLPAGEYVFRNTIEVSAGINLVGEPGDRVFNSIPSDEQNCGGWICLGGTTWKPFSIYSL